MSIFVMFTESVSWYGLLNKGEDGQKVLQGLVETQFESINIKIGS